MNKPSKGLALVFLSLAVAPEARAAVTWQIDESKSLTLAVGLRLSGHAGASDDGAGGPLVLGRPEFAPESALVGFTGQLNPSMKAQLNLGLQSTGELRVLDAIAMLDVFGRFQLWAGRMLPPVDRASLTGPIFASTWDLPFAGIRGGLFAGRDDGALAFGDLIPKRLTARVGVFRGALGEKTNPASGPLVAARFTLNLLAPEPGYYHSGTTFGARDVLSFGVGGRYQAASEDRVRPALSTVEVDALLEKKLSADGGVLTIESAVYRHADGTLDPTLSTALGFYAQAGYLFPGKLGPGAVQVMARYQGLLALGTANERTRQDLTLNYVVHGHPLRFAVVLLHENADSIQRYGVRVGAQFIL